MYSCEFLNDFEVVHGVPTGMSVTMLRHFVDLIAKETVIPAVSVKDAIHVMNVCSAIQESIETAAAVKVNNDLDYF